MAATTIQRRSGRTAGPHPIRSRVVPTLADPVATRASVAPTLAGRIVQAVGGRRSAALGIDPARGAADVERWFVASALHGNLVTSSVVARTFTALESAGVHRIADIEALDRGQLVALLDAGGYARDNAKTAMRLHDLAVAVRARYGGEVAEIGRRFRGPRELEAALDALPGWGPATVGLFVRELRGMWPGARPALDPRAVAGGRHLGLLVDGDGLSRLTLVSRLAGCDERDLEGALVRISSMHRRSTHCPGGRECVVLRRAAAPRRAVRHVALPGGRRLSIRPMRRSDAPGIVALYAALGEEDVYRRFFASRPPSASFVEKMATITTRGGVGLVVTVPRRGREAAVTAGGGGRAPQERIVAEATCEPLTDGDGELGITVAPGVRGWLGPYLLDALLEDAAAAWIPNVQADVLLTNKPMLTTLCRRGIAVMTSDVRSSILRVVVGTVRDVPSWPAASGRNRVVVEVQGGRWHATKDLEAAGYDVVGCGGPPGGWANCPPMRGEPCPLAAEVTVIVNAVPAGARAALIDSHRHVHSRVPVCAVLGASDDQRPGNERPGGLEVVPWGSSGPEIARVVQRMASAS